MPVYKVKTIFKSEYRHFIRANSQEEAKDLAHDMCDGEPNDLYWHDSEIEEVKEREADND